MRWRKPRTAPLPDPNATLDNGERVRVVGQPFRVDQRCYYRGLEWAMALFRDGKLRPVPAERVTMDKGVTSHFG